jgi:hypothetical protein
MQHNTKIEGPIPATSKFENGSQSSEFYKSIGLGMSGMSNFGKSKIEKVSDLFVKSHISGFAGLK